jgi:two-component system CheB/CheR fusion protein
LLGELNHRSKNMLAVIQSIASGTSGSTPEFVQAFNERLQALAINQDLLASNEWHGVNVDALVTGHLQPFTDVNCSRVSVEAPRHG